MRSASSRPAKAAVLAANIFGKIKTVAQMVAIPFVLLNDWPFSYFDASWGAFRVALLFVYIATLASLLSGVIYLWQNRKVLKEGNHD
jgi:CDP-diacylglycerol--glycerol-3-phosphate 3-phosphatidyltransferase